VTLGADKGYDTDDFVMELREQAVTPHVAQNQSGRRSAISHHPPSGCAISLCLRNSHRGSLWSAKTVAGLSKLRHRGLA
jgi:hypothetical protein